MIDRKRMLEEARILCNGCEDGENSEYVRGVCELIAYCYPIVDEDTEYAVAMYTEMVLGEGEIE
jgi:hypothetical protein